MSKNYFHTLRDLVSLFNINRIEARYTTDSL
jgi:hypothetical protein